MILSVPDDSAKGSMTVTDERTVLTLLPRREVAGGAGSSTKGVGDLSASDSGGFLEISGLCGCGCSTPDTLVGRNGNAVANGPEGRLAPGECRPILGKVE